MGQRGPHAALLVRAFSAPFFGTAGAVIGGLDSIWVIDRVMFPVMEAYATLAAV